MGFNVSIEKQLIWRIKMKDNKLPEFDASKATISICRTTNPTGEITQEMKDRFLIIKENTMQHTDAKGLDLTGVEIKFNGKIISEAGYCDKVEIPRKLQDGEMTEVERKFIMMARIGNLLTRNGLIVSLSNFGGFCSIAVQDSESNKVLEDKTSSQLTEQELLDWWSAIENDVK